MGLGKTGNIINMSLICLLETYISRLLDWFLWFKTLIGVYQSSHLCNYRSIYISVHLSIYLSISPSIHLFAHLLFIQSMPSFDLSSIYLSLYYILSFYFKGSREGAVVPFTLTATEDVQCNSFTVEVFENLFGSVTAALQSG